MKKVLSIAVAIILTLSIAAFAAGTDSWTQISLAGAGMTFSRPADMEEGDTDSAIAYAAFNDDLSVGVYRLASASTSESGVRAMLADIGLITGANEDTDYVRFAVTDPDNANYSAVVFRGADGRWYDIECTANGKAGLEIFEAMAATLDTAK